MPYRGVLLGSRRRSVSFFFCGLALDLLVPTSFLSGRPAPLLLDGLLAFSLEGLLLRWGPFDNADPTAKPAQLVHA